MGESAKETATDLSILVEEEEEEEELAYTERSPPEYLTAEQKQHWLRELPINQGCYESPIDLNLIKAIPIQLPELVWHNFEVIPKKTKLNNTGQTIIYSAKWKNERPYIHGGPLSSKYVFSNFHFHWGANAQEGSEHTIDGGSFPGELHVVFFKSCYLTQEAALKEQDGCVTLAYMLQLQEMTNPGLQVLIKNFGDIIPAGSAKRIDNICILRLFRQFVDDYYLYWGSVKTYNCIHYVLWLITRKPIGISNKQLSLFRSLLDEDGLKLERNFRKVQPLGRRSLFLVNPGLANFGTLLSLIHDTYLQYHVPEILYFKDIKKIKKLIDKHMKDPTSEEYETN